MKNILAIITLALLAATTALAAPDGFVSFYVGPSAITVVKEFGILEFHSHITTGAFQFKLNDEVGSTDYQVSVSDDGNPITWQIKNREGGSFKMVIWRLTAGEQTFTAIPYDPNVLCTVSVERIPE